MDSKMNTHSTSPPSTGAASEKGKVSCISPKARFAHQNRETVLGISLSWEGPRASLPGVPRKVNCRSVYPQRVGDRFRRLTKQRRAEGTVKPLI